ncbi:hypothetical protein FRC01_002360 [Tulasnella sp. 417]|nr:hypothetical protein FRC01_002360 [Tulasnella sp. 417]
MLPKTDPFSGAYRMHLNSYINAAPRSITPDTGLNDLNLYWSTPWLETKATWASGTDKGPIEHVMLEIITPRVQQISAERLRHERGLSWICTPWGTNTAKSLANREREIGHIKLMIHLLQNHDSYEPNFWASIVKWQIAQHKEQCRKLLQDYKWAARHNTCDENSVLIADALEKAAQRAYALEEPEKPTFADVFVLRNIYDDPDLKAVISSRFTSEQQLKLAKVVNNQMLQQPAFPPHCWSLLETVG